MSRLRLQKHVRSRRIELSGRNRKLRSLKHLLKSMAFSHRWIRLRRPKHPRPKSRSRSFEPCCSTQRRAYLRGILPCLRFETSRLQNQYWCFARRSTISPHYSDTKWRSFSVNWLMPYRFLLCVTCSTIPMNIVWFAMRQQKHWVPLQLRNVIRYWQRFVMTPQMSSVRVAKWHWILATTTTRVTFIIPIICETVRHCDQLCA
mmetsp:Transcript_22532/g.38908  ORF Transcript_22532/g.38908 Transcript_22532/m.38908 type:complete len:203 (-) Transcript_22532:136-744(-)